MVQWQRHNLAKIESRVDSLYPHTSATSGNIKSPTLDVLQILSNVSFFIYFRVCLFNIQCLILYLKTFKELFFDKTGDKCGQNGIKDDLFCLINLSHLCPFAKICCINIVNWYSLKVSYETGGDNFHVKQFISKTQKIGEIGEDQACI